MGKMGLGLDTYVYNKVWPGRQFYLFEVIQNTTSFKRQIHVQGYVTRRSYIIFG